MIQMINKLKKNQKGFTLVELIVVLVILAILAAFTIPAMLGFVNDAKAKALVAQTREIYMAYQSALTDTTNGQGYSVESGGTTTTEVTFTANTATCSPSISGNGLDNRIQKSGMNKLIGDVVATSGDKTIGNNLKFKVTVKGTSITEVKLTDTKYTITLKPGDSGSGSGDTTTEKGDTSGVS